MQRGLRKRLQAGRAGGGVRPDLGERKEERTGDLSSLNQLRWGTWGGVPRDNHPPQRAVLPPGISPVGTQDPPHQACGAFQDSLPLQPVSLGFSLELFVDSADGRAPGSGEQRAALRTEAEAVPRSCQSIMLALPSHDPRCSGGSELQEALTHTGSSSSPGILGGSVSGQKG